ncbi:hypothetical protein STAS_01979 [Striga asiatica]|uniref:Uncharacterized protein n=1 Tax=Striga asiatica TaxID=4170 RepID=A0A5A7P141_STRAF|nr:hypothetical protein STAS_01979 [Striga asiatica]
MPRCRLNHHEIGRLRHRDISLFETTVQRWSLCRVLGAPRSQGRVEDAVDDYYAETMSSLQTATRSTIVVGDGVAVSESGSDMVNWSIYTVILCLCKSEEVRDVVLIILLEEDASFDLCLLA